MNRISQGMRKSSITVVARYPPGYPAAVTEDVVDAVTEDVVEDEEALSEDVPSRLLLGTLLFGPRSPMSQPLTINASDNKKAHITADLIMFTNTNELVSSAHSKHAWCFFTHPEPSPCAGGVLS